MRIVGPIVVVEYDPAWAGRYAAEAAGVTGALGDDALRVEHVGSTSVPGLAAKPIIDVQVTVRDLDAIDRWRPALERAGYHHVAIPGCAEYPFLYRASDEGVTLAHVHLCRPGSFHEARHLALRDHLRAHPDDAEAYGARKRAVALAVGGNRDAYIAGKDAFVKALEHRALAAHGLPRRLRRVAVFCGSKHGRRASYGVAAHQLGEMLAADGIGLVYGAGDVGLMGRVAAAALAQGGAVEGYIPKHMIEREVELGVIGEQIVVGSMHERKAAMAARADAFLALPGGFGTLDELFEIVTWRQLGLHAKPVGLLDTDGFWQPLVALAEHLVGEGFVSARSGSEHLHAAPTPGLLLDALQWAAPAGPPDDRPFPSNLS